MRKEKDALGEMLIPEEVYYGIQTERARQNFNVSGQTTEDFPKYIWSIAAIKKAAALANKEIGALDVEVADAITQAADEILEGKKYHEFPIDIFQGGGGTSTNMNANEVIANRANEIITGYKGYDKVHPNTHVNMGQSTNDVIPSAMKIATYFYLSELIDESRNLEKVLTDKKEEFKNVVKLGRTCLQDAVPITLGQEFSGYAHFVHRQIEKLEEVMRKCTAIPLGATAIGTELSTFTGYSESVYARLTDLLGIPVTKEENFFDGLQNADIYIEVSSAIKSLATGLSKIATDLRILSSGPRAGLNEIELPAVQPGSSIMPGKVNPVMPELMNQIGYQICGNDVAITMAVEGGELDLNVWEPVIIKCLFESCRLLTNSIPLFTQKCIKGIKANEEICKKYAESSIALSTVIASLFGYKTGSMIAQKATDENKTIKEVSLELGILSNEEVEEYLDPIVLTNPEKSAEILKKAALKHRGDS